MNDAALMRRFEPARDLQRDWDRFVRRDRAPLEAMRKVFPVDELHDQGDRRVASASFTAPVASAFRRKIFDAINLRDVRMIERGQALGLARKPRQPLRI